MKLLASIKPTDVDPGAPPFDYGAFGSRTAARAIVFDGDKVALIKISVHDYYMLPGGGIEGDDILTGLKREILEELGCKVAIETEVGSIEVYLDRWQQKQTDFCYTARIQGAHGRTTRTDFEKEEGHEVVWADTIEEATKLVRNAQPVNRDGKLVQARDLLFLETAQNK